MRIHGRTKLAGVVGTPLAHTLSPAMHNAVYEYLGLDWVYVPLEITDDAGLRRFMALAPSLRLVGFNVTMPFKRSVLGLCDDVSMAARMAGAVNTVHVDEGRLVGYNTDGRGLLEALETQTGFVASGKRIVILGAGGAAGGALVAFILARAASVTVVGRDYTRAGELIERVAPHLGEVDAAVETFASAERAVAAADLVVNATPVGMDPGDPSPIPDEWIRAHHVVYDMVYGTVDETRLVGGARARGAVASDGLSMLVAQGATAVDIWNDSAQTRTPREVMAAAAEAELAARKG